VVIHPRKIDQNFRAKSHVKMQRDLDLPHRTSLCNIMGPKRSRCLEPKWRAVSDRHTPHGSHPASEIGIELNVTTFWMAIASNSGERGSDCGVMVSGIASLVGA
jgi:hypothetical protein